LELWWSKDRVQKRIYKMMGRRVRMKKTKRKKGPRMTPEKVRRENPVTCLLLG